MSELCKLHQAIIAEDTKDVIDCIKQGADINAVFNRETAFTKALTGGYPEVADVIITSKNFDPNAGNQFNASPLFVSVRENKFDYVRRLLWMGARVNSSDTRGYTPLVACVWEDNAEIARLLIKHGADIEQTDRMGRTALHHACSHVAVRVAQLLVEHNCDVNQQNEDCETPLMCALPSVYNSQVVGKKISDMLFISEMVIGAGSNLNAQDKVGKTALHRTVGCHDIHGLCLLAESGCEINIRDKLGRTPFHLAVSHQPPQFDIARFLLYFGADPTVELTNVDQSSPLPPLSLLLKLYGSFNEPGQTWSYNMLLGCLHQCVYPTPALLQASSPDFSIPSNVDTGQDVATEVCRWLQASQPCSLKFQAKLKIRHVLGSINIFKKINVLHIGTGLQEYLSLDVHSDWLPLSKLCLLHLHIREHRNDLMQEFIENRRNINLFIEDRTPLAVAIEADNIEVAKMLLSNPRLCPAIVNCQGDTALHAAAKYGRDELIDETVMVSRSIDSTNYINHTPLQVAMQAGNFKTAAILIKKGADINSPSGQMSLLHMAAACGCCEIVDLILARGLDPNLLDIYDNTPLHLAASKGGLYLQRQVTVPGLYRDPIAESLDAIQMILNDSRPMYIKPVMGHAEVAKSLISHGASLTKVNKDLQTALKCAELFTANDVLDVLNCSQLMMC